jgi:tetratricopeptide (TPR) repeat protein
MYRIIKKILDSQKKYEKAISKNDHPEGIKWLLKIIDADKEHNTIAPKAKVNLGKSYRILKQYKDAMQVLEEVIKVSKYVLICDNNNNNIYIYILRSCLSFHLYTYM